MEKIHWASQWLAKQNIDDIEWIALGIDVLEPSFL